MKSVLLISAISLLISTATAASRCTATNGLPGSCIPTKECGSTGGKSDPANLCPGGDDIQCCTWGECTSKGIMGVCMTTGDCSGQGGTSDPANLCPGPQNIQCCTYGGCTSNGQKGTCMTTGECAGIGGKSDPANLCPGPQAIQCCTTGGGTTPPGGGSKGELSDNGLHFIAGFEGWNENFYRDSAGVLTIGYGHACQPESSCNNIKAPISRETGDQLLRADAKNAVDCVKTNVKTSLTQNQFDACVSFTFNLGCGGFQEIVDEINARNFQEATRQWLLYVHAGTDPNPVPGLVRRRREEVDLFNKS